jgi:DNA-binding beta-propeller fold protein YncE
MISTRTTVTTAPVKIITKAINRPRTIVIRPDGNDVYIGGSDVTTSNGLKIDNNTNFTVEVPQGEELWAVVPTGTHAVIILTHYAATS